MNTIEALLCAILIIVIALEIIAWLYAAYLVIRLMIEGIDNIEDDEL